MNEEKKNVLFTMIVGSIFAIVIVTIVSLLIQNYYDDNCLQETATKYCSSINSSYYAPRTETYKITDNFFCMSNDQRSSLKVKVTKYNFLLSEREMCKVKD